MNLHHSVTASVAFASGFGAKRTHRWCQSAHPAQMSILHDHLQCAGRLDPRVIPNHNLFSMMPYVHRGLPPCLGPAGPFQRRQSLIMPASTRAASCKPGFTIDIF